MVFLLIPDVAKAQEQLSSWRLYDSTTRELVESIEKDKTALKRLIEPAQTPTAESFHGFQLQPSPTAKPKKAARIRFEFPEKITIDAVAIYPVVRPGLGGPRSLGMPKQFRILFDFNRKPGQIKINLAARDEDAPPLYEIHDNDTPSSPLPVWIEFEARTVKSLTLEIPKLTLISNDPRNDSSLYGCMFAEIEIYQGEVNVARSAKLSASDSLERESWGLRLLNDDRTPLGQPENSETPPNFRGYHSEMLDSKSTEVSIEYRWSEAQTMDAIRLHPAKPDYWNDVGGYGFPQKFTLSILPQTPPSGSGSKWSIAVDQSKDYYPNPDNNDITFQLQQPTSSVGLKLTATLLSAEPADLQKDPQQPKFLLALAEMSGLQNGHTLPKPDSIVLSSKPSEPHWTGDGLVDGYTSTGKIISGRRWASDLSQRRILTGKIFRQEQILGEHIRQQNVTLFVTASVVIAVLLLTVIVNWSSSNRRRIRAVNTDRERIANDLHDEVGGALGSISLLSQKLLTMTDEPAQKSLLDKIHNAASEARAGVREAVWATGASSVDNKTFESHLRAITDRMLPDCEIDWQSNGSATTPTFAARKQHHFGMFFREAIHNIQKHANASTVSLRFQWNPRNMTFTLADNGEGLQSLPASSENFRTLRYRAEQLPAKLEIDPNPEGGTRFTLTTPLT